MAQLLQPLFVLVLIITLIYQPRGVKCLEHMDYQSLLDIKNSMNQNQLGEAAGLPYCSQYIQTGLLLT